MTEALVLGVDVGGSTVRAALADRNAIVAELAEPTRQGSAREIVGQLVGIAGRLTAQVGRSGADLRSTIGAVGVAVPTFVDHATNLLGVGPGLPGLGGAGIVRLFESAFGVPVSIDNDANMAALAEGAVGAAVGVQNYVALLLSVGIGMGIVMDGELRRGWRGRAGEIGWLPLTLDPAETDRSNSADFEGLVALDALRQRVSDAARRDPLSALSSARSFQDAARAADSGDAAATRVVEEEARLIGTGLAAVIAVLDPELIVLCGQLGSVPSLVDPVRKAVDAFVTQAPLIVTSKLGHRGELVGAIVAAREAAGMSTATARI